MASQSSKKTAQSNAKTLKEAHIISLVINVLAILAVFVLHRPASKLPYVILSLPALFCQYTLEQSGRPTYSKDKVTGNLKLIRSGDDIKGEGLFEYMFDCLYITWFIDILMILLGTNHVWWIYLVIPAYFGYKATHLAKSFFGSSSPQVAPAKVAAEPTNSKSKRQSKLEARREKGLVQIKRR